MFEPIREEFPDRFFDVGICESHAVAFAAGLAKAGLRPVVAIYSTFMQRSYDQIFQEMALQNLPVTLLLDRAGLVGPDGPTHHGVFDITYLRPLPNLVIMAPGDEPMSRPWCEWRLNSTCPTAIRYPQGRRPSRSPRPVKPIELGKAEVLRWGGDGMIDRLRHALPACVKAAERLAEEGLDVGVINARFVKPLDTATLLRAVRESPFVVMVEEGALMGGFGSAVLEAACRCRHSTPAASAAWAFPTNSSNTAAAANCWPTSASMPRALQKPAVNLSKQNHRNSTPDIPRGCRRSARNDNMTGRARLLPSRGARDNPESARQEPRPPFEAASGNGAEEHEPIPQQPASRNPPWRGRSAACGGGGEAAASRVEKLVKIVHCDFTGAEDMSAVEADLAIVLGGDGSILRAARQMSHRQLPVIAANLGKLGYLANITSDELVAFWPTTKREICTSSNI